jgi:rhodanese-related sulfurtransferase
MTAHWLAQMGWDVAWLNDVPPHRHSERGPWRAPAGDAPAVEAVSPEQLAQWLAEGSATVIDFAPSAQHVRGHIPGAWWALRSHLHLNPREVLSALAPAQRLVTTCADGGLARYAAADLSRVTDASVFALDGGNAAWRAQDRPFDAGDARLLSRRIDRNRRPYEGTDATREAMQAYLDWEFGLVAQLGRDGTHGFRVLDAQ